MNSHRELRVLELVAGALLVLCGVMALVIPGLALGVAVVFTALLALVRGAAEVAFYFSFKERTGPGAGISLIAGVAELLLGILLLCNIGAGKWAMSVLFPLWLLIACATRLANLGLFRFFSKTYYWANLIVGAVGILCALILLISGSLSMAVLNVVLAILLIVYGALEIALSFSGFYRDL